MLGVGLTDPLDLGVTADGLVEWVHHDHLVELVGGILGHPIAVQHTQFWAIASNALLQQRIKIIRHMSKRTDAELEYKSPPTRNRTLAQVETCNL